MDDFNKRFGLKNPDSKEIRNRFLNRANSHIFKWLDDDSNFSHSDFACWISLELGEPWDDKFEKDAYGRWYLTLKSIAEEDFIKTLRLLEKCYRFIADGNVKGEDIYQWDHSKKVTLSNFNRKLEDVLAISESDLSVFWKEGKFYKAGAKELDDKLISDSLDWLQKYPEVRNQFDVALNHFKNSLKNIDARKDSITNAYSAMEGLTRKILNNKGSFDKNSDKVADFLELPKEYRNIFRCYKQIAHEYSSRHAASEFEHIETEAFIYMTGLLMRLMLGK